MFTFTDQEREYNRALQKERAEGRAEGKVEGKAEGKAEGILSTLVSLVKNHLLSVKDAAQQAEMTEDEFIKKAGLRL